MPTDSPTLITVKTAAKLAGLSLRHFRRISIDNGTLPVKPFNKKFFVLRTDLDKWLSERQAISVSST